MSKYSILIPVMPSLLTGTPEYLAINPPRQSPGSVLQRRDPHESAVIAQFVADLKPGGILPTANTPEAALCRARVNFIVSEYFDSVSP
jgi:glutathione S-transferase